MTQTRITVLNALEDMPGHPTADEVFAALAEQNASVSRATVFNVLDDLAGAALVMRADAGPGAARYEAASSFHHHFVCTGCGSVADVPCADGTALCLQPEGVAGRIDGAQIIFRGLCIDCLGADS